MRKKLIKVEKKHFVKIKISKIVLVTFKKVGINS